MITCIIRIENNSIVMNKYNAIDFVKTLGIDSTLITYDFYIRYRNKSFKLIKIIIKNFQIITIIVSMIKHNSTELFISNYRFVLIRLIKISTLSTHHAFICRTFSINKKKNWRKLRNDVNWQIFHWCMNLNVTKKRKNFWHTNEMWFAN